MVLSIIIPSYNHGQFVLNTIRAALSIDIADKEIIVIDDGSSDNSSSVIREYLASSGTDSNVRLIARENRGLVKTLNEGLSAARGKYFYLVASDDIPIPKGIKTLVDHLEGNAELQFSMGNALFMNSEYQHEFKPAYGEIHRHFFSLPDDERQKEMFFNYPQPLLLQATVFRTSALRAIDGWREDIISDDFSQFLRLFSRLKHIERDFTFQPDVMACFYRRHDSNISKNLERQFMTIDQVLACLCPPKLQSKAYLRNFAAHGLIAVRLGRLNLAMRLFRSTADRTGYLRSLLGFVPALFVSLTAAFSRRFSRKIFITHAPPLTQIES